MVHSIECRGIRILRFNRPVHHVHVYEVALIPMYLLIGVWGSGRKEYAAMKLTLMLMGGSAFLLIGILGIFMVQAVKL